MDKLRRTELPLSILSTEANPAQVRMDIWSRLREILDRLAVRYGRGMETDELEESVSRVLGELEAYERYWVFPGPGAIEILEQILDRRDFDVLAGEVRSIVRRLGDLGDRASLLSDRVDEERAFKEYLDMEKTHYFTVVVVSEIGDAEKEYVQEVIERLRDEIEDFVFNILYLDNMEDALVAAVSNFDVQAVVIGHDFPLRPAGEPEPLEKFFDEYEEKELASEELVSRGMVLAGMLREIMPHLDLYLISEESLTGPEEPTHLLFNRVFYSMDNTPELLLAIIAGVRERYRTPFFDALKSYAESPVGNFHALPIARGNSILNSRWIRDMEKFYGINIFLAETSSTTGGLDSLLAPGGTIREAQEKASATYGSEHTFFVTNGTSTSNKIVLQALTRPGDIVMIDRNCHKSHHYGLVLVGACPLYLDAYPLEDYAFFGAVPLRTVKKTLLDLRRLGRLDKVKMLLLTNCTFDGITYNPAKVMEEVLAIKPDICFLWDEAWYAFAGFHPLSRVRTGMYSARVLAERYASDEYRSEYGEYRRRMEVLDPDDDTTWLDNRLMPDPDEVRIRVYSTQSTHKSQSSLRQGSMIHVRDQDFGRKSEDTLNEAILTHSTTSPNYQIVASLDLARRQADMEGYAMVSNVYQMAFRMREEVAKDPILSKYFRVLTPADLIPWEYRESGLESYTQYGSEEEFEIVLKAWEEDELVLDPSRITLYLAATGFNGNEFKVDVLMDEFEIQVNKTSINSVLLIFTIGVTWSSMSYLLDVLRKIATEIDKKTVESSRAELNLFEKRVEDLSSNLPPLPAFSCFHEAFRPHEDSREGDMRAAFFLSYEEDNREHVTLEEAVRQVEAGRKLVASTFVVPYPPGFPVMVPGQVIGEDILDFMMKLDVKEIHGYRPELGLSVFTDEALKDYAQSGKLESEGMDR